MLVAAVASVAAEPGVSSVETMHSARQAAKELVEASGRGSRFISDNLLRCRASIRSF